ncbi:MAG TPA: hypothetical protein VMG11_05480 [Steroidobacteraceae bacterium]|nr:hypothetical protein [Steroidobacteraceae bacterium]
MGKTEDRKATAGREREHDEEQEQDRAAKAERVQRLLDEALADSFPASDPVSIVTSQHEEDCASSVPPEPPEAERARKDR